MNPQTQLGYCCINLNLRQIPITVNRTCRKATFQAGGLPHVSNLALQNIRDLVEIIKWNQNNGFKVYRMSSDLVPWASEFQLSDMKDYQKFANVLKGAGALAKSYGQRITSHPGPFNVLVSPKEKVVQNTITDLTTHGEVFDMMGLSKTP